MFPPPRENRAFRKEINGHGANATFESLAEFFLHTGFWKFF